MTTHCSNQQVTAPSHTADKNSEPKPLEAIEVVEKADKDEAIPLCDDVLIDMKYLVYHSGLSDKHFYSLIKRGMFPKPIKLGRSSRWKKSEYEQWLAKRIKKR